MNNLHPLQKLVKMSKNNEKVGIYSACSANEYVIEAVLERAKATNSVALIEATSNQVNQFGGYTGMLPKDFRKFVESIAAKVGVPMQQVILGGDHLGPLTWTNENEESAMLKADELIRQYVLAGFTKIHIDTSMRVNDDDKNTMLSTAIIARRGARLAKVANEAYLELLAQNKAALEPVYIVGSEVPIPGGAQEDEGLQVTKVEDFKACVETFKQAFYELGLQSTWERVVGVVVQPGVEFGDTSVEEYNQAAASELSKALKEYDNIVFEGHSTDYQTKAGLRLMVEDGIAILKVGPALTFALREAIFALAKMEDELYQDKTQRSNFIEVLEKAMLNKPSNWQKHYHGNNEQLAFKRKYSFSDRARYYLPEAEVVEALNKLISNINNLDIPVSLLSQYMPSQYTKVRNKEIPFTAQALLKSRVADCIDEYLYATNQASIKF